MEKKEFKRNMLQLASFQLENVFAVHPEGIHKISIRNWGFFAISIIVVLSVDWSIFIELPVYKVWLPFFPLNLEIDCLMIGKYVENIKAITIKYSPWLNYQYSWLQTIIQKNFYIIWKSIDINLFI